MDELNVFFSKLCELISVIISVHVVHQRNKIDFGQVFKSVNNFFFFFFYLFALNSNYSAKPDRDHVFHVSFPGKWTQNDIVNQFRKFGPVQIRWIDDMSAFVALIHRENASILLKSIEKAKGVKIITFATYELIKGSHDDVRIILSIRLIDHISYLI